MRISTEELITNLVEEAKQFPNAIIEYNFELPKMKGITKDKFLGVNARFNSMVSLDARAKLIYKLS